MTEEAASRFEISVEPRFPLDVLRSLRNEVDALLGFLASESKTERPENDAAIRESPTKPVRGRATVRRTACSSKERARDGRHRWSAACNRVAASKRLEDFTNFRSWREAESSIFIQEGPPNKSVPLPNLVSGHPARNALPSSNTLMPRQDANWRRTSCSTRAAAFDRRFGGLLARNGRAGRPLREALGQGFMARQVCHGTTVIIIVPGFGQKTVRVGNPCRAQWRSA